MKVSIIVPCYNEEKTVGEVIKRLLAVPFGKWNTEIIVVNDGSTDGTTSVLDDVPSGVKVINLLKNSGKGSAVNAALKVATGDFAIIQDADLECNPEEIPLLLAALGDTTSDEKIAVIGSRELQKQDNKGLPLSRLGSLTITKLINILYGTSLTDTLMGYKLFPKSTFGYFKAGGFESEMLFLSHLLKDGYRIVEVPVSYNPREEEEGKKIRYRDGIKIIIRVLIFRIVGR